MIFMKVEFELKYFKILFQVLKNGLQKVYTVR